MKERFKFRHVYAVTGTFVLVLVAVLITAVILAGRSQRWFIGNATLWIVLPEEGAEGIRQGSEVYFLGTLVGTVSAITVNQAGRMEARVSIRRDFFRFVRVDSSAVVNKKFGVVGGDSYFEITRGHGLPLPERNASIVCNKHLPSALETTVDEIRREAVPALKELRAGLGAWTALGTNLAASRERLDQFIGRANIITSDLLEGKGTAGKLLTDPVAADELTNLLLQASRSVAEVQYTLTNLQTASANLELASTNLPTISVALDNEAKDLPGLVMQTQVSMRELERLIEAIQRHWLVRKYVIWTNPPPLRPLPGREERRKRPVKEFHSPKDSTR